jgi:ABC-type multidrug transport system fused ATPase/permease subunit
MPPKTPNTRFKTSGRYLLELLQSRAEKSTEDARKYEIAQDIFIKQSSYAILNKIFFFIALVSALAVAFWPILSVFLSRIAASQPVGAAVVQTTITAFAAFTAYIYTTYKKRQTSTETLLRLVAFSPLPLDQLTQKISDALAAIDQGITFKVTQPTDP